jgi:hypothetical protein
MLNEQEQMKVLLHKILMSLNPNKTKFIIRPIRSVRSQIFTMHVWDIEAVSQ